MSSDHSTPGQRAPPIDRAVRPLDLKESAAFLCTRPIQSRATVKPCARSRSKGDPSGGSVPRVLPAVGSAIPRFVRLRDVPAFFGMNKNLFNREVRPLLTEIRIGKQGRAFDRLEMEAAAVEYMSRNGRPAAERSKPWDKTEGECQDSNDVVESGTSTRSFTEREFAKALARAIARKPKRC
jgi:hypothetical protein